MALFLTCNLEMKSVFYNINLQSNKKTTTKNLSFARPPHCGMFDTSLYNNKVWKGGGGGGRRRGYGARPFVRKRITRTVRYSSLHAPIRVSVPISGSVAVSVHIESCTIYLYFSILTLSVSSDGVLRKQKLRSVTGR